MVLRFLVPLLVSLYASSAAAQCLGDGVQLFPTPGSIIPTNSRFLLEGVGTARPQVAALVGKKLRLVSDSHVVEVAVQRGWESSLGRVTVILKPAGAMEEDKRYTLRVDEVLPNVALLNGRGTMLPEWRTGKGPDKQAPRWLKRPAVSEGFLRRTAQGTARFVRLNLSLKEDSPAYLVVKLEPRRPGPSVQQYVVPVSNNTAFIGHEACSGTFAMEDGRSYRARIQAFDAAGQMAPAVPPVDFEAPDEYSMQQ
ncbi:MULTISPECIES: hypothetical protein [Myxococcus]|uniref:Uncharacterized protein n=1 Tax=Myxococcus xanthus TaxID=34 RepID=A0AAE6KVJ3_MYXXA|nr:MULTISPECIES: hypothetical protein [Myxococcus]QDE71587.1 hypothetical protein BHS09_33915 [Myxococcus xanthus]QDE78868.1 hypothetical protein BHS08_33940 [Myxococcus xanthus]QDE86239.1 hypothetical protein BHS07_34505 [Myxococcus xanthus]QDF00413.1 hypothetical protein BHS05_33775 [Myxococcus xanthus]QDF08195.1 hypothetical protein BHS04_34035 [Myxococcus xanthus]